MGLQGHIVSFDKLSNNDKRNMWLLQKKTFLGIDIETFDFELSKANCVILLKSEKELCGFSMIQVFEVTKDKKEIVVVYSGETVIAKKCWGTLILSSLFAKKILKIKEVFGNVEMYWFCTLKGFRAYRYFPILFKEYYPMHGKEIPKYERELITLLGNKMFAMDYDENRQIVQTTYAIRNELDVNERPNDEHHKFFVKMNPRYRDGEELACIAKLDLGNINELFVKRLLRRGSTPFACS